MIEPAKWNFEKQELTRRILDEFDEFIEASQKYGVTVDNLKILRDRVEVIMK